MRWFKKINEIVYYYFKIKSETLETEYTLTELIAGGAGTAGARVALWDRDVVRPGSHKHFQDTQSPLAPKVRV